MDLAWTRFIFGSYLDLELMDLSFLHVARIGSVLFPGFWGSHGNMNSHVGLMAIFDSIGEFLPQLFLCVRISLCALGIWGRELCPNPMALELGMRIDSILQ